MNSRDGSILVGIVFAMLILSLMALTGVSMLANQSKVALNIDFTARAHATALGATQYVLRELEDHPHWGAFSGTIPALPAGTLGGYNFSVGWNNPARDLTGVGKNHVRADITASATFDDTTASKNRTFRVMRLPRAFYYALFWGNESNDPGMTVISGANPAVWGNVYANGNATFSGANPVAGGKVYYTGSQPAGVPNKSVTHDAPPMPVYDTNPANNSYEARILSYAGPGGDIASACSGTFPLACGNVTDTTFAGTITLTGNTLLMKNAYFSGNVTLTGTGKVVAWNEIGFQPFTPGACGAESPAFLTRRGGCCQIAQNRAWGKRESDRTQPSAVTLCEALGEAGFSDWVLPSQAELQSAAATGASAHFSFVTAAQFWSRTPSGTNFITVNLSTGASSSELPNNLNAVVCSRTSSSGQATTLTVQPSGGDLEIITGGRMFKYNDPRRILEIRHEAGPGTSVFYARNGVTAGDSLILSGGTTANQALFMADRNLTVSGGASLLGDGVLYVRNLAGSTGNMLEITGPGDLGALTTVDGSLISISEGNPNMRINGNSRITGIVYSRGSAASGRLDLGGAVIQGSVVANLFGGAIAGSEIDLRDPLYYPTLNIPDGFTQSASMVPGSWDGT